MTKSSLMRRHAKHASAVALSTLLLGACAVGPDYRNPPPVDTGSGWTQPSADAQARLAAADAGLPDIRARLRAATLGLGVLLGAPPERELALEAARRSYAHAQTRFKLGDIALTDLLAEERIVRDAEQAYVRTHTSTAIDLVALFKALGGGWDAHSSAAPQANPPALVTAREAVPPGARGPADR